jgi:predicted ribosomally synthesized peptide with SipW-like signal peptide
VYLFKEALGQNSEFKEGELRHFAYNGTFFHGAHMPVDRCLAYSAPGTNCTASPGDAGVVECPDVFDAPSVNTNVNTNEPADEVPTNVVPTNVVPTNVVPANVAPANVVPTNVAPANVVPMDANAHGMGTQQVLIGSLGCGGMGTTAYWSAESWIPGTTFTPRAEGVLDFGIMYAPKTAASFDGRRRVMFGWVMETW